MMDWRKGTLVRNICIVIAISLFMNRPLMVEAKQNLITRGYFIKLVCKEIGIEANGTTNQAFINAAVEKGVIKTSTFKNLQNYVTKLDAAIILTGAHEYLYGATLSEELIGTILEKRITDLSLIPENHRIKFAKAYAYGYLIGKSDGSYSTSRTFEAMNKITRITAIELIDKLKDEQKRSKISEDGQLLRTEDLPTFAEFYPYILASYPDEFYDWEFQFMKEYRTKYKGKVPYKEYLYVVGVYKEGYDYAFPDTVRNYRKSSLMYTLPDGTKTNLAGKIDYFWEEWEQNAKIYLENVFNIDYRTVDKNKTWYDAVTTTGGLYNDEVYIKNYVNKYIDIAKKNKTIIECDKIGFDKSCIYEDVTGTYLRVYVHYRINSSLNNKQEPISPLAFTFESYVDYSDIKLGEWRNGYFDILLNNNGKLKCAVFSDYYHDVNVLEW